MLDPAALKLSAQRALLFSIAPSFKYIFVEVVDDVLIMLAYVSSTPTQDERDLLYAACSEMCGDFVELKDSKSKVHIMVSDADYVDLPKKLKYLVYAQA